jgi:amino acid permease
MNAQVSGYVDLCHPLDSQNSQNGDMNQYWKNPGAFNRAGLVSNLNTDRFLAFLSVLVQASFSYQGVELVAM